MFRANPSVSDHYFLVCDLAQDEIALLSSWPELAKKGRALGGERESDPDHCGLTMRACKIVFPGEAGGGGGSVPPSFRIAALNSSRRVPEISMKIKMPFASASPL